MEKIKFYDHHSIDWSTFDLKPDQKKKKFESISTPKKEKASNPETTEKNLSLALLLLSLIDAFFPVVVVVF